MLVNYGNASGHVPPLDLLLLAKKGSLSVARPGFHHLFNAGRTFQSVADELFKLVAQRLIREESVAPTLCAQRRWRTATLKGAALSAGCCYCRNRTFA
jgi:hypothetical protein